MAYVNLQNVSIEYPIYGFRTNSIKKEILYSIGGKIKSNNNQSSVKVLNNISLNLKSGDRYVVYGHNGVGKTTLLKIISQVLSPTSGTVNISGKVSSLIDLSMGMDPESTGYENIITRSINMGYTKKEIINYVDEISEFCELGDYLNLPLNTFSTGMRLRLGFAISIALPADIIVMDEWLSVGDIQFREKAEKKLKEYITSDSILIVASHDQSLAEKINAKKIIIENESLIL